MLDSALSSIPAHLRSPIIDFYVGILDDYSRSDFEGVGTKSGKICETVYCILVGLVFGTFPSELEKPKNFVDSCRDLENKSLSTISRSHRIQIPKVLIAIYEMRNNRSIGHVHSEISPNYMDAEFFVRSVKWIVAELVRTLAGVGTDKAAELVDSITMINTPMVWNVNGQKRVLDP